MSGELFPVAVTKCGRCGGGTRWGLCATCDADFLATPPEPDKPGPGTCERCHGHRVVDGSAGQDGPQRLVPCPCSAEGLVRSRLLIADVPERFWDAEAKMLAGSAYIHGATGVGKTTRACGALKAWTIANGEGARFMSVRAFQDAIGRAIHDGAADPLERYERAPFLVIDDLGKERVTPETWKKLDSLMDTRYGWPSRVTVITSEFALTDLAARIDALAPDKPGAAFARRISALVADRIYRR